WHGRLRRVRVALVRADAHCRGVEYRLGPAPAREIPRGSAPPSRHAGGRRRDMTPRPRRMTLVFGIIAGGGVAGALALSAFRNNVTFFFDPSKVAAGEVKPGQHFRLGGMVTKGSVK